MLSVQNCISIVSHSKFRIKEHPAIRGQGPCELISVMRTCGRELSIPSEIDKQGKYTQKKIFHGNTYLSYTNSHTSNISIVFFPPEESGVFSDYSSEADRGKNFTLEFWEIVS